MNEAELYGPWMQEALQEAALAAAAGEVPVGAVVACARTGQVVARARNCREAACDPLGHAEILAIRAAARALGRWRLSGCVLVSTLEPCFMCAGAIVNARLETLVFGAADAKAGAVGSLFDVVRDARLNHRAAVVAGIGAAASAQLLRRFFAARRKRGGDRSLSCGAPSAYTLAPSARPHGGSDDRAVEGA